jgi:hypothetical protein
MDEISNIQKKYKIVNESQKDREVKQKVIGIEQRLDVTKNTGRLKNLSEDSLKDPNIDNINDVLKNDSAIQKNREMFGNNGTEGNKETSPDIKIPHVDTNTYKNTDKNMIGVFGNSQNIIDLLKNITDNPLGMVNVCSNQINFADMDVTDTEHTDTEHTDTEHTDTERTDTEHSDVQHTDTDTNTDVENTNINTNVEHADTENTSKDEDKSDTSNVSTMGTDTDNIGIDDDDATDITISDAESFEDDTNTNDEVLIIRSDSDTSTDGGKNNNDDEAIDSDNDSVNANKIKDVNIVTDGDLVFNIGDKNYNGHNDNRPKKKRERRRKREKRSDKHYDEENKSTSESDNSTDTDVSNNVDTNYNTDTSTNIEENNGNNDELFDSDTDMSVEDYSDNDDKNYMVLKNTDYYKYDEIESLTKEMIKYDVDLGILYIAIDINLFFRLLNNDLDNEDDKKRHVQNINVKDLLLSNIVKLRETHMNMCTISIEDSLSSLSNTKEFMVKKVEEVKNKIQSTIAKDKKLKNQLKDLKIIYNKLTIQNKKMERDMRLEKEERLPTALKSNPLYNKEIKKNFDKKVLDEKIKEREKIGDYMDNIVNYIYRNEIDLLKNQDNLLYITNYINKFITNFQNLQYL